MCVSGDGSGKLGCIWIVRLGDTDGAVSSVLLEGELRGSPGSVERLEFDGPADGKDDAIDGMALIVLSICALT